MKYVHLNGRLVPEDAARISPFDRGFTLGDAVFESFRAYRGRPFGMEEHLARLKRSCEAARIPLNADLPRAVHDVLNANGFMRVVDTREAPGAPPPNDAAIRITVTRGIGGRGASPKGVGHPTVLVTATVVNVPPEVYEKGLSVVSSARRRIPESSLDPGIKSTNYLVHVLARMEAEDAGADDALFLDAQGHVIEATQANVFAVKDGKLLTPPLTAGCLPGATRTALLKTVGPQVGVVGQERLLTVADLQAADEVLLTSSVTELAPVVRLDGKPIGAGVPGRVTRLLHEAYRKQALQPR